MNENSNPEDHYTELSFDEGHPSVFTNNQVYLDNIPTTATLEYSKLEAAYRNVSVISVSIFFGIAAIIVLLLRQFRAEFTSTNALWSWAAILVIYLLVLTIVILEFKKKSYALRERDLIYNEGIIWQSSTVIPFNRVQHCEVSQGPIERLFGLSELKIFTAGGSGSDMSVPGLSPDTAKRLKEYIVAKTGQDEEE